MSQAARCDAGRMYGEQSITTEVDYSPDFLSGAHIIDIH